MNRGRRTKMRENIPGEAADGARAVPGLGFLHPRALQPNSSTDPLSAPLGSGRSGKRRCRPGLRKDIMENPMSVPGQAQLCPEPAQPAPPCRGNSSCPAHPASSTSPTSYKPCTKPKGMLCLTPQLCRTTWLPHPGLCWPFLTQYLPLWHVHSPLQPCSAPVPCTLPVILKNNISSRTLEISAPEMMNISNLSCSKALCQKNHLI